MAFSPNQRLGAYEIVCALGAGGMGEVYRARDARLGREVALKVLPPEVIKEPGRLERFDREARAIAALNHPHIVTIYSTEQDGDIRFLTMELVDGCTLGDLVVSTGMALPKFLEIAIPLADALAAAHQKQITHRDLKPGNVMVSNDGRVKVLDFGLARMAGSDHPAQSLIETLAPITHQGMIVGTMPYMSPEQVEGRSIDARSDLFSLGVIFYELLSGQRPFRGGSSPALMSAILRDTPPPLAASRNDIPEPLDRLVTRLIEKRPEDRVQTARDVFNELKHVQRSLDARSSSVQRPRSNPAMPMSLAVAVLPFTVRGADSETESLAAALTDDITTSLGKFAGLSVIASQTTRAFKDSPLDVRQIAERVHARYVITGNLRRSGSTLRTTAQLIDAQSGEQLWTEIYDRQLGDVFAVQDDLTDHIVATLADRYGVLARSMYESVQSSSMGESSSMQLLVHTWGFQHRPVPDVHLELRAELERRVDANPNDAHLWAELANMYVIEHSLWLNPQPNSIERAQRAARRAIEIDRFNQSGWLWLAITHFHQHDRVAFEEARDTAVRLNPRNAYAVAWMGNITTHAGEYDRGCALTERAMTINPAHPGWLHFAIFNRHMANGEFEQALHAAKRANMREFYWMYMAIAAACGHLGRASEGRAAADEMVRLAPFLGDEAGLREFVSRWYWPEEMIETVATGVLLARSATRSEHPSDARSDTRKPPSSHSSGSITGSATTVAVLPLVPRSSDDESKAIADGLTDDITAGLSKFGYLRVLSRSAAERAASGGTQISTVARYAVEGQVRKAGTQVRVNITLVDTQTGTNLWTHAFDRDTSGGLFAIQDDVSSAVVANIGDQTGVLMRAIAAAALDRPLEQLTVAELVVRYHLYAESFDPAEHARLRDALEHALKREPRAAEGWACLSFLYEHEHSFGFNPLPDSRIRERQAAERAHELDPNSQQAWIAVAGAHCFARDRAGLINAVERAARINPLNAELLALGAVFLSVAGEFDRATALITQAMALKPQHAGWYYYPLVNAASKRGNYEEALAYNKKINMPRMALQHANAVSFAGHLGLAAEARAALHALRTLDPRLAEPEGVRAMWAEWIWDERWLEEAEQGFRKAKSWDV